MGSPGAGKTAVLEATARATERSPRRGPCRRSRDRPRRRRLQAAGIAAKSITTGSACHLDAQMVHKAMHDTPWRELDYLFIENVGNLVCPAIYDLGQAANVVALVGHRRRGQAAEIPGDVPRRRSRPDHEDRPAAAFARHRLDRIAANLAQVMPKPLFLPVSAQSGEGIDAWMSWLDARAMRERATAAVHHHHHDHHHHHSPDVAGVER